MPPPIVKLKSKKEQPPHLDAEDDLDNNVPAVNIVATKRPLLVVIPKAVMLTDDEVTEEIEAATERPSSFGYSLGHIRTHLANKDYNSASLVTKEALLTTLIELVPLAETSLRQSGANKGIYQFNSLVGQVRELLVDLDGERDMSNTIQSILDEAIRPVFMLLTQMIIQFSNSLKRQLKSELNPEESKTCCALVDEQVKHLGNYVQGMYSEVQSRVDKKMAAS